MKKIISLIFLVVAVFAYAQKPYKKLSLNKVSEERKEIAQSFLETFLDKCKSKDYSDLQGFNFSKRFSAYLVTDSLQENCPRIIEKYGEIQLGELVSVHESKYYKDFIDIFNFKVTTEKYPQVRFLHIGLYRDGNFLELPLYFDGYENYAVGAKKRLKKK